MTGNTIAMNQTVRYAHVGPRVRPHQPPSDPSNRKCLLMSLTFGAVTLLQQGQPQRAPSFPRRGSTGPPSSTSSAGMWSSPPTHRADPGNSDGRHLRRSRSSMSEHSSGGEAKLVDGHVTAHVHAAAGMHVAGVCLEEGGIGAHQASGQTGGRKAEQDHKAAISLHSTALFWIPVKPKREACRTRHRMALHAYVCSV